MSNLKLKIDGHLKLESFLSFVFNRKQFSEIEIEKKLLDKSLKNHNRLCELMQQGVPIYGVTTGFGDNATRYVDVDLAEKLQSNLIQYLTCGLGESIPVEASRAMCLVRLNSLSQGLSAVTPELLLQMKLLLEYDILPIVPVEGSLGASGDLIPLAYLGQVLQGQGEVFYQGQVVKASQVFEKLNIKSYKLKSKEGLAIVNGTSTMAGLMTLNLKYIDFIIQFCEVATAMQCLVLNGKREAFGRVINEIAKTNPGQSAVAKKVSTILDEENYHPQRGQNISVESQKTMGYVQDRYSLRCVPQILGPILDYQKSAWQILDHEVNSVTDNPVINDEGNLEMGGNFYGGYLSQAMDMSKINLAHVADLIDRQVMMLVDDKSNRGLPANLVDLENISESEKYLHHGLKGLHQATSAITSELMQKSIPNGIFSRSSESHNQDKVSLGMSSAVSCLTMIDGIFKLMAMQMTCLCQAVDIQKIELQSAQTQKLYKLVRQRIQRVSVDARLGESITALVADLKKEALIG